MPAATITPREPAIITTEAAAGGGAFTSQDYHPKRKNSAHLPSSFDLPSALDTRPTPSPPSSPFPSSPYNGKHPHQLYNRSNSNLFGGDAHGASDYNEVHLANDSTKLMENDLSTRHVDAPANPLQNLWAYVKPQHYTMSDNAKFVCNCCAWYISSSLTNNTGKQILNVFRFPVTLTFIQFGLVALWCYATARLMQVTQIRKPTREIAKTIVPLAIFLIVGHVFSSIAISRVPVSLVHTIKALAPLFTVLFYRFIFGVRYSSKVYLSLLPLTLGVILACTFTFSNNVIGLMTAFLSCLVFVTQNIFSKKLLFKEAHMGDRNPNKLDKMNVLFYSSLISFLLMVPLWLYSDGAGLAEVQTDALTITKSRLATYFLLNGTTNFGQNWFAFTTLSMTSPVTYSIASLVKRIFVIVMSIVWFGQQVSVAQSMGILLTFVGLWMYQSAKRDVDRGESQIREKSMDVLPTNANSTIPASFDSRNGWDTIKSWIPSQWSSARESKIH
ncbi:triose-phosphate transporter family-domain-containing protein [Syncephalastrum racemosum]|uniref:Triose-phosphate transporter family-domain-containing protein n=1 Tax=Syncephalastrum racemosum TaxID=13706 RepID=A0A1X2HT16_SYNRA|nr:triose-phosphate transporter family-domain-containing protein [Syncephalastrum racemosum]